MTGSVEVMGEGRERERGKEGKRGRGKREKVRQAGAAGAGEEGIAWYDVEGAEGFGWEADAVFLDGRGREHAAVGAAARATRCVGSASAGGPPSAATASAAWRMVEISAVGQLNTGPASKMSTASAKAKPSASSIRFAGSVSSITCPMIARASGGSRQTSIGWRGISSAMKRLSVAERRSAAV